MVALKLVPRRPLVIVMGLSGCGKSTLAAQLAEHYSAEFIEGDDLHSEANIEKMTNGIPLTDGDRWPWLEEIGRQVSNSDVDGRRGAVASCSALRLTYRDYLRNAIGPGIRFVYLHVDRHELLERLRARKGHFMKPEMLESQMYTLDLPFGEPDVAWISLAMHRNDVLGRTIKELERPVRSSEHTRDYID